MFAGCSIAPVLDGNSRSWSPFGQASFHVFRVITVSGDRQTQGGDPEPHVTPVTGLQSSGPRPRRRPHAEEGAILFRETAAHARRMAEKQ
jgi:hypothetical protein